MRVLQVIFCSWLFPFFPFPRPRRPSLSTSFHKFGNVFPTPSPGPPRLVKAPAAGHPLPRGERVRRFDSDPSIEPQPSPLAGEGARGTRAGEGLRGRGQKEVAYVSVIRKRSTGYQCREFTPP